MKILALWFAFLISAALAAAQPVLQAGASLSAPSMLLKAYAGVDTVAPSQTGLGWAGGRATLQTPVGAMQFYTTGSPAESVIYWPGRIVTANLESTLLSGSINANNITSGVLPPIVVGPSLPSPLQQWQMGTAYAAVNGLTYVTDADMGFNQLEPTIGVWFPNVNVANGGATGLNYEVGRYRTAAQFRTDLGVPEIVSAPASASATGTAGQIAYDASFFYVCVAANTWKRAALATW